jgi:acyl-coenzyme A thioesterase 13
LCLYFAPLREIYIRILALLLLAKLAKRLQRASLYEYEDVKQFIKMVKAIPEGFSPLNRPSPFIYTIGPVYIKNQGEYAAIALCIEDKHANARGIAHGGVLASLADIALGYNLVFSTNPPRSLVTINLTIDFIDSARKGDWIEAHVEIQKKEGRTAFASARLISGDKQIARASGIFLMGKPFVI